MLKKQLRIILIIQNKSGKNIAFVTDDHQTLGIEEAINKVLSGLITGVHIVKSKYGYYLRSDPNDNQTDNLESLAVPAGSLTKKLKKPKGNKVIKAYLKAKSEFLEIFYDKKDLIYLDGLARTTKKEVFNKLKPLSSEIRNAAKNDAIDPILLSSILTDEIARMAPDDLMDILGKYGIRDTSVGLAQVKMSTAREIIKKGYYKANPNISDKRLYNLLSNEKEAVKISSAYLRMAYDYRRKKGISTSDIAMANCYSHGYRYNKKDTRGEQIIKQLTPFARKILRP